MKNSNSEKICGQAAVELLKSMEDRCPIHEKDNTGKLWSYKFKAGSRAEFAFDPRTSRKLGIWLDRKPPPNLGLTNVENIQGKSVSTALGQVFSGKQHQTIWKVTAPDEECLMNLIGHLNQR